jgi:hypothetical protein
MNWYKGKLGLYLVKIPPNSFKSSVHCPFLASYDSIRLYPHRISTSLDIGGARARASRYLRLNPL